MAAPKFSQSNGDQVVGMEWDGYAVSMYRSPNTGDMIFSLTVPEGYEDEVDVNLNDDRMVRE